MLSICVEMPWCPGSSSKGPNSPLNVRICHCWGPKVPCFKVASKYLLSSMCNCDDNSTNMEFGLCASYSVCVISFSPS